MSRRKRSLLLGGCVAILPAALAKAQPNYQITELGLTGTGYTYTSSGMLEQSSFAQQMNTAAQVIGTSNRYDSSGDVLGFDSWLFNGTSTQQIGLTGGAYGYAATGGTYQDSAPTFLNNAGQVVGTSYRFDSSGGSLGQDAWIFSGSTNTQIGLTGTNYTYTTTGANQSSLALQINDSGTVVGTSSRYDSSGNSLGQDAWIYNGSSTQVIGFTGTNYSYSTGTGTYRQSSLPFTTGALYITSSGQVLGSSARFDSASDSLGADSWTSNGTSTVQIGLIGAGYSYSTGSGTFESSVPINQNNAGQAIGYSLRYDTAGDPLGADSWVATGTNSVQIGLTGTAYQYNATGGVFQFSTPAQINNSGHVLGVSARYDSSGGLQGQDAWVYDGSSNHQVGLTGTNYGYPINGTTYQYTQPKQINNAGQAIGYSQRFDSTSAIQGQDAWFYNGSNSQSIGLTGAGYSYVNGIGTYQYSDVVQLNNAGQVIGYSSRFDSAGDPLGQSGYLFDSHTDVTTPLVFSVDSSNDANTFPALLTDNGVVLGSYDLYSGSTDEGVRAFYYSLADGFHDMGSLVNGGLTAQGWQYLADVYDFNFPGATGTTADLSPEYILGDGVITNQDPASNSVYLLSAPVPEPSMIAPLLVLGSGLLLARRKRRTTAAAI